MSLATTLLKSLGENAFDESYAQKNGEPHIVINASREVIVPEELRNIAVKMDKDIETVTFDCVRYWDDNDLSTFAIYLNYVLPDGESGTYIPDEIVANEGEDVFHFDWKIKDNITRKSGKISFAITAIKTKLQDGEYVEEKRWSSFLNNDCSIAEGLDVSSETSDEEEASLIAQISALLEKFQGFDIVQTTGQSTTAVMSQKAVTDLYGSGGGSVDNSISITSFTATPNKADNGNTINVTLKWSFNKTPSKITINGSNVQTNVSSIDATVSKTTSWTLKVEDDEGNIDTKTTTVYFMNRVYYGSSVEPAIYDSDFISGLDHRDLSSSKITEFYADPQYDQYIYYCLPESMGTCSFTVNGFTGGFSLVATIEYVNKYGHAENYRIYRSDNVGLGQTDVSVS